MEYIFVLTLIALSVVVGFILTYWDSENAHGDLDNCKPLDNTATTRKCPCCGEEINGDAIKCKKCASMINTF